MKVKYINLSKNYKMYYLIESGVMLHHFIKDCYVRVTDSIGNYYFIQNVNKIVRSDYIFLLNGDKIKLVINNKGRGGYIYKQKNDIDSFIKTYSNYRKSKQKVKEFYFI